ncbi:MAG TPA: 3-dehydroquinate synthase [Chitinophagaceae bacterium]|nr:3-dehydroquinate synthase [Chitinophagaceae bacterium]
MDKQQYKFSGKTVDCYFDTDFSYLEELISKDTAVIITDENIVSLYAKAFEGWKIIAIRPGEENKQQSTVDHIIGELIKLQADRDTFIVGVGGGVITDIAGYAASVYMRGVKFAFVPTSVLAMVDAAVGGKNGVDVGLYKNLVGVIRHPEFLLYDYSFLKTLPREEWINGFAEIIKHGCIKDADMFDMLENNALEDFQTSHGKIAALIKRNVEIKYTVVSGDEFEKGERKLLNFGHTLGHAIENFYKIPHGNAVSNGMVAACKISEKLNDLSPAATQRVIDLLKKYELPVDLKFDTNKIWEVLLMDKKKSGDAMNFILLDKIGDGIIKPIPLSQLKELLFNYL